MSQNLTVQGRREIKDLIEGREHEFARALQNNINPGHFVRAALTMVQDSTALMACTQSSLFSSLLKAAQLSLSPDGILGQAYLVPYGGKAQLIIGYKGLRELALRTNKYKDVRARVVYMKDEFKITLGTDEMIIHVPFEGDRGEKRGVYAVAITQDGTAISEYMSRHEVDKHKAQYSKSWKKSDSIWQTAPERAWEKTVIRRLCNRLQMSVVAQGVLAKEDLMDAGLKIPADGMDGIIDVETGEITDDTPEPEDKSAKDKPKGVDGLVDTVKGKEKPVESQEIRDNIVEKMTTDNPKVFWAEQVDKIGVDLFGDVQVNPETTLKYDIDTMIPVQLKKLWDHINKKTAK